jgi:hypothetical protein
VVQLFEVTVSLECVEKVVRSVVRFLANHHLVDTGESRDKSPGDVFA